MNTHPLSSISIASRKKFALALAAAIGFGVSAQASTLLFDFSASTGDRALNFGTNQISGAMSDSNLTTGFFVQSSEFKYSGSNTSAWSIVNDSQPSTVNATLPAGSGAYNVSASSTLTLRSRITSLTSGKNGSNSYGGFVLSLDSFSSTGSGVLAVMERNPNTSAAISLYNLSNGALGSQIQTVALASNAAAIYFLDFTIGSTGAYTFNIYTDASISGTGNDPSRLTSSSFGAATPYQSLTGTLSGYDDGYAGFYTKNTSATTNGGANFGNFYMDYTAVPEPRAWSMLSLGGAVLMILRRRHRLF